MIEDCATAVRLPGGLWVDGVRHQEAWLRPFVGADEAFLETATAALPLAGWTTTILTRCLTQLGPLRPVAAEAVRSLCVGDREALVLQLRQLTLGDCMAYVANCPACGQGLDLSLRASELLVPSYPDSGPAHEILLPGDDEGYHVRFRLATGGDQEAVAGTARTDVAAAAASLVRRCVLAVRRNGDSDLATSNWPDDLGSRVSERIGEVDAQAEISLNLRCPECDQAFSALLDAAACFRRELGQRSRDWCREVHFLAFHYHWSEQAILAMPPSRRRRYVEILADALRGGSHA